MGKEEEIFKVGCLYKIEEQNGKIWTALIVQVQGDLISFKDREGQMVGLSIKSDIKKYRQLKQGGV